MKLVLIPAGWFAMGSPKGDKNHQQTETPQRDVTISKAFYMGICHVTRGQFAAFVGDQGYKTDAERDGWSFVWDGGKFGKANGASWKKPGFDQTDEHPVVSVSHNDARAFCEWLSKKTGRNVKLPTEAQWEYSCRAGTNTTYQWGENPDDGKGWCNAADQTAKKTFGGQWSYFSWDDGYAYTSPVGTFKKNAFGLCDMHGNAWQWCADWFDRDYYSVSGNDRDPQGPNEGQFRVLRGGSWMSFPATCRSAIRVGNWPGGHNGGAGFRVVVEIK